MSKPALSYHKDAILKTLSLNPDDFDALLGRAIRRLDLKKFTDPINGCTNWQ